MNGLLEYRLSLEDEEVRRLVWILQVKKPTLLHSKIRKVFNQKRDNQIIILKGKGFSIKELCITADNYECGMEMFK